MSNCMFGFLLMYHLERQADIFQTGIAIAMDKGLEFVGIVEHGVKFEDKSDHDIGNSSK